MLDIPLINLGIGNVASVKFAFNDIGAKVRIVDHGSDLGDPDMIVLPGVGNFHHAMEVLAARGFSDTLSELVLKRKVPFLGICLGMQLLADWGDEGGAIGGLGFIPGKVVRLNTTCRVPHVGWDDITVLTSSPLFEKIPKNPSFYFVHSYFFNADSTYVSAICNYGTEFPVAVQKDNIFGVQFHPEKSQHNGIELIRAFYNFARK